jgi:molybdopterin-guanine dinucleotide biosynthesis protein A
MGAHRVDFDDQPLAFRNFNTLDDLSINAGGTNA